MISKDTIKRTAGGYWSDQDECFIFESPLFDRVAGTGDTIEEAREMFEDMLDDLYPDLKAGNVLGYTKVGRPAKEGRQLNCKVRESTHEAIALLAEDLQVSQGEIIDVLAFHYVNEIGVRRLEDVNKLIRLIKSLAHQDSTNNGRPRARKKSAARRASADGTKRKSSR